MSNPKVPTIILEFLDTSRDEFSQTLKDNNVKDYSGPTQRSSTNNLTLSYNIYPEKAIIDTIFLKLAKKIQLLFGQIKSHGEYITYTNGIGEIYDQGVSAFSILNANHYEFYIYDPESVIYARLLKEYDPRKEKTWISIDYDIIIESAWFKD